MQKNPVRFVGLLAVSLVCVTFLLTASPLFAQNTVHVVEPGETLSEIAVTYGTDVETLRRLNELSDVDLVWVGLPLPRNESYARKLEHVNAVIEATTPHPLSADAGAQALALAHHHVGAIAAAHYRAVRAAQRSQASA